MVDLGSITKYIGFWVLLTTIHSAHGMWLRHADNRDATHITHPLSEITNSDSNFPTFADRNKRHLDPVPIYSTSEAEWRLHQQPIDVYQDGDTLVAYDSKYSGTNIDDVVKRATDEILVEPLEDEYQESFDENEVSKRQVFPFIDLYGAMRSSHVGNDGNFRSPDDVSLIMNDYARLEKLRQNIDVSKRGAGDKNEPATVELLILVDNSVYRRFAAKHGERGAMRQIEKHYTILAHIVNLRYNHLEDDGVHIVIKLAGIYVAERKDDSRWTEDVMKPSLKDAKVRTVDPIVVLEGIRKMLLDEASSLPQYDHAMAFTSYELENSKGGKISGMAYVSTICRLEDAYACSIIEETGGLANVGTAVHELGHSLGARHDGEDGNKPCPKSENHVMSPSNSGLDDVLRNTYTFSRCSVRQIKRKISSSSATCLYRTSRKAESVEQVSADAMTPLHDIDWQCQEVYGPTSGQCAMEGLQSPEDVCARLWCRNPDYPGACANKAGMAAVYGSPCGQDKVCRFGYCVAESENIEGNTKEDKHEQHTGKLALSSSSGDSNVHASNVLDVPESCTDMNAWYCRTYIWISHRLACSSRSISDYCCQTCALISSM